MMRLLRHSLGTRVLASNMLFATIAVSTLCVLFMASRWIGWW